MLESVGSFADNLGFVCKFRRLCRDMRRNGSVFLQKKLVFKAEAACHANIAASRFCVYILLFPVKIGYHDVRKIVRGTLRFLFCVCVRTDFKQH